MDPIQYFGTQFEFRTRTSAERPKGGHLLLWTWGASLLGWGAVETTVRFCWFPVCGGASRWSLGSRSTGGASPAGSREDVLTLCEVLSDGGSRRDVR